MISFVYLAFNTTEGALLAKGRLIGIQFLELFKDGLYFKLAEHANKMAGYLKEEIDKEGFGFLTHSPSNQIFPILPNTLIDELLKLYAFYVWDKLDENNSAVRLVTSWATEEIAISSFIMDLKRIHNMEK